VQALVCESRSWFRSRERSCNVFTAICRPQREDSMYLHPAKVIKRYE